MTLPYSDPSNPALPSPLFSDLNAVRADHLRANNAAVFADLAFLDTGNPPIVALTNGSFKTAALANANTYNGSSLFTCTAGVTDTPYSGAWRIFGTWNPTDSSGRFVAMLDSSLETWEINYAGAAWGTWTKYADSYGNRYANAFVSGYNTTATSGGTLTLDVSSAPDQFFTGTLAHTVVLPVVSTLQLGRSFFITNISTGVITVNSSGGDVVARIPPSTTRQFLCVLITGTDAASWLVSFDSVPVGHEMDWSGLTPPTNYIVKDGSSLLRSSYPALFAVLCGSTKSVTNITIGANAVFTAATHGLSTLQCISFEGTTPGGVTAGLSYYVTIVDGNTFKISDTMAHAIAGTFITTSGTYSDVILRYSSFGTADILHFNLPDERGIHSVGAGIQGTAPGWAGTLSNHVGILGLYEEDRGQALTGNVGPVYITGGATRTGVFSGSTYSGMDAPNMGSQSKMSSINFNSANSSGARTGVTTRAARVGKMKLIKYQ